MQRTVLVCLSVILVFAGTGGLLLAQEGPGPLGSRLAPQAPDPDAVLDGPDRLGTFIRAIRVVAAFLELTDEQEAQVKDVLISTAEQIRPYREELRDLERLLASELNSGDPTPGTVGELVIGIHELRNLIDDTQRDALGSIRDLLDEQQSKKVEAVLLAARLEPVVHAFKVLGLLPPITPPLQGEDDPELN